MSVQTRADEIMGGVKEHIEDATRDLSEVMNTDVWGSEDYDQEVLDKVYMLLRQAVRLL